MQDQATFRVFFNGHLHPILREFEKKRKALLLSLGIVIAITGILSLILVISKNYALLLFIPIILWGLQSYISNKIRQHIQEFKPLLIPEMLKFMKADALYNANGSLSKEQFNRSGIFGIDPAVYSGEDLIAGKSGQISYEICELLVMHPSEIRAKLEKIFDGVFLHAMLSQNCHGKVFIVPRANWQKNSRGIKSMVRNGTIELEKIDNTAFDARFRVFYDVDVKIHNVISPRLQENLIRYYDIGKSEVYTAFINQDFYLAMQEGFDLLDSSIFRSNLSFDKIYGFYRDLQFYLKIIEDVDRS
jgi:hypothetical protein